MALMLAACGGPPPRDAVVFSSVEECSKAYSSEVCEKAFRDSSEEFRGRWTPWYPCRNDCEDAFGEGSCWLTKTPYCGLGPCYMPRPVGIIMGKEFVHPVYQGPDGMIVYLSYGSTYAIGLRAQGGVGVVRTAAVQIPRGGFGVGPSCTRGNR